MRARSEAKTGLAIKIKVGRQFGIESKKFIIRDGSLILCPDRLRLKKRATFLGAIPCLAYTRKGRQILCRTLYKDIETRIYCYDPKKSSDRLYASIEMIRDQQKWRTREVPLSGFAFASFFLIKLAAVALKTSRTVNSDWYTTICLLEANDEIRKNKRKRRIILHHNNASSHTARQTNKFLKKKNVELMINPAYSPNLVPCDFFFLCAKIKNQLRGQRFSSPPVKKPHFDATDEQPACNRRAYTNIGEIREACKAYHVELCGLWVPYWEKIVILEYNKKIISVNVFSTNF
ncbi:Mariner Mos1 transposase [Eumeta japonica]|uniref:Mariner Mos1 transposase n=1 Tax=Eumeta variegata TaxID=151549 RepID=A0A4C1XT97_EUMVA|nr:Mariner Mos1 transposase [Eumeta japonica]